MKVIRNSVFETNSSSSHSLSIVKRGVIKPSTLSVDTDKKVHVTLGDFGWGYEELCTQEEKLSYLCTMIAMTEGAKCKQPDQLYKTAGFRQINSVIKDHCKCNGVIIDDMGTYDRAYKRIAWNGYIDHQSYEDYTTLNDFLQHYNVDILNVLFNNKITIIIDNDNH